MIDIKRLLKYIDDNNFSSEEAIDLIKDNELFELEYKDKHIKPVWDKSYNWFLSRDNIKLPDADANLLKAIDKMELDLEEIGKAKLNYEYDLSNIGKQDLPVSTWLRILKRELFWRAKANKQKNADYYRKNQI